MKILSVNAGSSSLKFTLFELPENKELISGVFEKIGIGNSFYSLKFNGDKIKKERDLRDHSAAIKILMEELINNKIIDSLDDIDGVGHRVVHGGEFYAKSTLIDEDLMTKVSELSDLAPLHNPANLIGIKAFRETMGSIPMVAVFDTAFHQSMEATEYIYPALYDWFTKYGVRKYGFHGTSHRYIDKKISEVLKRDDLKVISCHIGNGGSITAIDSHLVKDTSMGFTPLAGLMMGTRSGDIDSSIIPYIMNKENKSIDEVMNDLNKKSGLLGISGVSSDSRDVEVEIEKGNERAELAQNIYVQKIANYIAMYNNLLNGADVLCFTAGVGENSVLTRKEVCEKVASLGIEIDLSLNNVRGEMKEISSANSKIPVYVVPTNEELMIATDTYDIIK